MQSRVVAGQVAGLNVAVAGFGARRLDAKHHDIFAGCRHREGLLQGLQKSRLIGDHVVRGKNAEHRIGVLTLDEEGCQSAGRSGVTGHRLLHDLPGRQTGQLIRDFVGQVLVGDNPGPIQVRRGPCSCSTVCWIMDRSPSRASTCLARARRERGQKRVPLPPASITGRKSISFNMEETSYPTDITFGPVTWQRHSAANARDAA